VLLPRGAIQKHQVSAAKGAVEGIADKISQLNGILLLPIFFIVAGLEVDLSGMRRGDVLDFAHIVAAAVDGVLDGRPCSSIVVMALVTNAAHAPGRCSGRPSRRSRDRHATVDAQHLPGHVVRVQQQLDAVGHLGGRAHATEGGPGHERGADLGRHLLGERGGHEPG
jgi:hypothetical protein